MLMVTGSLLHDAEVDNDDSDYGERDEQEANARRETQRGDLRIGRDELSYRQNRRGDVRCDHGLRSARAESGCRPEACSSGERLGGGEEDAEGHELQHGCFVALRADVGTRVHQDMSGRRVRGNSRSPGDPTLNERQCAPPHGRDQSRTRGRRPGRVAEAEGIGAHLGVGDFNCVASSGRTKPRATASVPAVTRLPVTLGTANEARAVSAEDALVTIGIRTSSSHGTQIRLIVHERSGRRINRRVQPARRCTGSSGPAAPYHTCVRSSAWLARATVAPRAPATEARRRRRE